MLSISPVLNINKQLAPLQFPSSKSPLPNLFSLSNLIHQAVEALIPEINQSKLNQKELDKCIDNCSLYGLAAPGCIWTCQKLFNEGCLSDHQISLLT